MPCEDSLAHVLNDGQRHLLHDHLIGTAAWAACMAAEFGCKEWAILLGCDLPV